MAINLKYTVCVQSVRNMKNYIAVGLGGVIGSSLRYLISLLFWSENFSGFPMATLIANLSGAFVLTYILFHPYIMSKWNPSFLIALTAGVIGSYTTFSTITIEVVMLARENISQSVIYLLITIFGGLLCSFAGFKTSRIFAKRGVGS